MKTIPPDSKKYLFFLIFLIISFCLYSNSLKNNFVLDDKDLIVKNAYIKNIELLPNIFIKNIYQFSAEQRTNYYRPLQLLTYACDYAIWGLKPFGYHLTNILLHSLNSFLIYLLILMLFARQRLAFMAAALYCVCPLNSSVVAYISGRADILVTIFMLLSIIKFIQYAQSCKLKEYAASLVFFILALLSRENALLLPFLLLISYFVTKAKDKNALFSISGFFIVGAFYTIIRFSALNNFKVFLPPGTLLSFSLTLINVFNVIKKYLVLFAYPWPLYPMRTTPFIQSLTATDTVLLFSLFFLMIVLSFKDKKRIISFGFSWFILALLPITLLIYTFRSLDATMAENWLYLPAIGFFTLFSYVLGYGKKFQKAIFAFILCFYSASTIINNKNWKDDSALYKHILKFSPDNYIARINLANVYYEQGLYREAINELKALAAKKVASWAVSLQLANVYLAQGDINRAVEYCKKAVALNPKCAQGYYNLGLIYEIQGKEKESLNAYLKALEINPDLWKPYLSIGDRLMKKNLSEEAFKFYRKAIALSPEDKEVYSRIGLAFAQAGRYQEGLFAFRKALNLDPNSLAIMQNIAATYGNMGRLDQAIKIWKKAIKLDPHNEEIKANIEKALYLQRSTHAASVQY